MTILQEFAVAFGEMFADLAKALFGGGAKPAAPTQPQGMEFEPPDLERSPFSAFDGQSMVKTMPIVDSFGNFIDEHDYRGS